MTTRRSLRVVLDTQPDAENPPAPPPGKQAAAGKKLGKPRAAFIDLTNAIEKGIAGGKKNIGKLGVKKGRVHRTAEAPEAQQQPQPAARPALKPRAGVKRTAAADAADAIAADGAAKKARRLRSMPTVPDLTAVEITRLACDGDGDGGGGSSASLESTSSADSTYETPPQGDTPASEGRRELESRLNAENESRRSALPDGVIDFDAESADDIFAVPEYVADVFRYYREREARVVVKPYLETAQPDLSEMMRAILVDWMVEVQESFELNHETLYMAVQLVDVYLGHVEVSRETLQLVGATAIFVACKFDERLPPPLDDFLYICEDAYARREVIMTEMKMLRTVNFDLGLPVSYRFLRRYARCCKLSIEVLTLARYVLEMSLMEYQFVSTAGSLMAAAALSLAVLTRLPDQFESLRPTIEHFSGYTTDEFKETVHKLNSMLRREPSAHLKTIRAKYSHQVFHQVARIPVLETVPL